MIEESNIISSSQFPESLDKIQYLEYNKYKKHEFQDEVISQAPRFTKELINIEVYENTQVKFECSVEPAADPNLKVSTIDIRSIQLSIYVCFFRLTGHVV